MAKTLYALPFPSSAISEEATLHQPPGRICTLLCVLQSEDDEPVPIKLFFDKIEAYRCAYQKACTPEMVREAYDKVVDLGDTEWLAEVVNRLTSNHGEARGLRHLMIYFDDGPCYEFICSAFRVEGSTGLRSA